MKTAIFAMFYCWMILCLNGMVQADAWPAESWASAVNLTSLDVDFGQDLSGAFYNSQTRVLWVCQNGMAGIWALVEDGGGSWMVRENGEGIRYEWDIGTQDLEDLTQADLSGDVLLVINEATGTIQSFDLSQPSVSVLIRSWNVSADLPVYSGGLGPEGIAFVPDEWLACRQFQDRQGQGCTSLKGMGGLVFIAHQAGGHVFAFDLNPDVSDDYNFVGRYESSRSESCALSFEIELGLLYIWHNIDANHLEMTDLTSEPVTGDLRRFRLLGSFNGPSTGNLEGFAAAPQTGPNQQSWCFLTCDDCGADSLRWFQNYHLPDITPPEFIGATPRITDCGMTQLTLAVGLNETGKVYFVVISDGDPTPDYRSVRGGRAADGSAPVRAGLIEVEEAGVEVIGTIADLNEGTAYDVYLIAEDDAAILQTAPVCLDATTLAATPTPVAEVTPTPPVPPLPSNAPWGSLLLCIALSLLVSTAGKP